MKDGFAQKANDIALYDFHECVTESGIVAGTHHFVDLWGRDSLFASLGAIACGEETAAKKTIETFLSFQRSDGLIPYRVLRSPTTIGKYFGHPTYFKKPKPDFRSHQSGGIVPDGGLMTVIASDFYFSKTNDAKFLKNHYVQFLTAMSWYEKRFSGGLIREWFFCEWADAVLKIGTTLYTNILYWKALTSMSMLAKRSGDKNTYLLYKHQAETTRERIRNQFWNNSFFVDWIDYKKQNYLSSHANLLAIFFGFTTLEESESILKEIVKRNDVGWTLETNDPKYPFWRIPFWNYLVGMGDYHNRGCIWLQPGILFALALQKIGRTKDARERLERISKKIIEYNGVFEVYDRSGKPLKRALYQSEGPFAWSAGLYLLAYKYIIKKVPVML